MKKITRFALGTLGTLTAFCVLTSDGRAQNEVVLSYVTFYGFDDNDDGNPTHLGTDVISHATLPGTAHHGKHQDLHRSPAWPSRKAWVSMQELDKHRTRCSPPALTIRAFPNTVGCSRAAIGILPAVYLLLLGERTDAKGGANRPARTAKTAYSAASPPNREQFRASRGSERYPFPFCRGAESNIQRRPC